MLGVFKDYQGGQCVRGRVCKAENKGDEAQRGVGGGSCRVSASQCEPISFYSESGGNQKRVLHLCLMQSKFNPIQKPEEELALPGHRDTLLQEDLVESGAAQVGTGPP